MKPDLSVCQYCQQPLMLVNGHAIYPHRPDLKYKKFWSCLSCDAYVGTHKNSKDHKPLGTVARPHLRQLRSKVHQEFDPLWQGTNLSRSKAYKKLAELMQIPQEHCHISWFNEDQCVKALNLIPNLYGR
tara:strand:- start:13326 stop:13712 length:387 start_codon:yes stop_codon:yes gene_type:complete